VGKVAVISVLTPTFRSKNGLAIVEKALKRQTFKDFEWLIGSPEKGVTENLTLDYRWFQDPPKQDGDRWVLNKVYNSLIEQSGGDLIVSIQDYTFFDPDTLEKFWFHFTQEPKTLVTGVGNKYESVYPVLGACVWEDPRINNKYGTFYPCYFSDIEWNFCSVPKQALYEVGGFDERLDKYYGMDGYSVNDRVNSVGGYDFKINQTIRSYSLLHNRPEDWDEANALQIYSEYRKCYVNPRLGFIH